MDDEILAAESALAVAYAKLGTSAKTQAGVEKQYAMAYQRLVRLGARLQIRRKYRANT